MFRIVIVAYINSRVFRDLQRLANVLYLLNIKVNKRH